MFQKEMELNFIWYVTLETFYMLLYPITKWDIIKGNEIG